MRHQTPYILAKQAEDFLSTFAKALDEPEAYPVLFNIWGIGGVGKTTLRSKVREKYSSHMLLTEFSFGDIPVPISALELMEKLYKQLDDQLPKPTFFSLQTPDEFKSLCERYKQTIEQLQTRPVEGAKSVTQNQLDAVKNWPTRAFLLLSALVLSLAGNLWQVSPPRLRERRLRELSMQRERYCR